MYDWRVNQQLASLGRQPYGTKHRDARKPCQIEPQRNIKDTVTLTGCRDGPVNRRELSQLRCESWTSRHGNL